MKQKDDWALRDLITLFQDESFPVDSFTNISHGQLTRIWLLGFECFREEMRRKSYIVPNKTYRYVKLSDIKELGEKPYLVKKKGRYFLP